MSQCESRDGNYFSFLCRYSAVNGDCEPVAGYLNESDLQVN